MVSKKTSAEGTCLCGAVTLSAPNMDPTFSACHCDMCRRWGGGPLLSIKCGSDVQIEGAGSVAVFDSSEWAERGFCSSCGTHLFYRLKHNQEYHVPLGLFGDAAAPSFGLQVYIDNKSPSYTFADETEELTEAQIIEMYTPKS